MKRTGLCIAAGLLAMATEAQVVVTTSSLTYVQDFNTLDSIGSNLTAMPPEWRFSEWGGTSANAFYRASTGSATAGDTYSFGMTGASDRALGALCSSGVPHVTYGVRFVNQTSAYVNNMTVTYKGEHWRRGGTGNTDSVRFFFSTARGRSIADTSFSAWIEVPALLLRSVTMASPASAINGNDTARVISARIPLALPAGDTLAIRWYDFNSGGNDDGLAIDSLTVSFAIGPPPPAFIPTVTALSPPPQATGVALSAALSITFDKQVVPGPGGNIYVKNRSAGTLQTIAAASGALSISGRVATISGILLAPASSYHVTFDSLAFDTAGFRCRGLYDTTAWVFSTGPGTTGLAEIPQRSCSVVVPAIRGMVQLACYCQQAGRLRMTLSDLAGRRQFEHEFEMRSGANQLDVFPDLPPGAYYLYLIHERWQHGLKILIE